MKKISLNEMVVISGGALEPTGAIIISAYCITAVAFWPWGTLMCGPSCLAFIVALGHAG